MVMPPGRAIVSPAFVGRAVAFGEFTRAYERAVPGAGQTVLVSGEAGIGKSRFVAEARAHVEAAGGRFLQGNCFEQDRSLPFAPFADLIRTLLLPGSRSAALTTLEPFAVELIKLVPELALWMPGVMPTRPLEPEQEKRRLYSTVSLFFLEHAYGVPTVLAIEDVHWADEMSRGLILFLSRRARASPMLLLLTYRSDYGGSDLEHLAAQLGRQRDALAEISLPPLTDSEVAELVRGVVALDRPVRRDFVQSLHRVTDGNPFFVEEVLTSYLASGAGFDTSYSWDRRPLENVPIPRSVSDALRGRVDRLGEAAREMLESAAVAGRYVDLALLEEVTGRPEAELLELVDTLVDAQLLAETTGRLAFRHVLIQQAVYAGLPGRRRRTLHLRVAEAIEHVYATSLETHLSDLAYHAYRFGEWPRVLAYEQTLGARALSLKAPHAAAEHFSHALDASGHMAGADPLPLYLSRARARHLLSDFDGARADYEQVVDLAQVAGDTRHEWQGLLALGQLWTERDYAQAGPLFRRAADLAAILAEPGAVAHSQRHLATWLMNVGEPVRALEMLQRLTDAARRDTDPLALARALQVEAVAASFGGDRELSASALDEAISLMRGSEDMLTLGICLALRCFVASPAMTETVQAVHGSLASCTRDRDEALAVADAIEWRAGRSFAQFMAAWMLASYGQLGEALDCAREALEIATELENRLWAVGAHNSLGDAYLSALDPVHAAEVLDRGLALSRALGSAFYSGNIAVSLARAHLMLGDLPAAHQVIQRDLPDAAGTAARGSLQERRLLWVSAELALARHDPAAALQLADRLSLSTPGRAGPAHAVIPALSGLRGQALLALGRSEESYVALAEARQHAENNGELPLTWQLHRALAQAQAARRQRASARLELSSATDAIQRLAGSLDEPGSRQCFQAAALASLPRQPAPTPLQAAKQASGGLSRREREVAVLVAEGRSTADIAAALVISGRTVEAHIANIYAKLGLSSRAQLASWVIERGPPGGAEAHSRPLRG
jgi:DNA-binding CsgD family transcriptional regulator/tetratricopeptide (TPR) repeat protein